MLSSIQQTQVNLDGLLEILGKNLYSTPSVAIRELIQNAHDACLRYQIETGTNIDFKINLTTNESASILEIRDNGSGLLYDEIQDYLATVGSGYTRVLRDETQTQALVGYFGLGFLSAYVVADTVEVITTSYQTPDKTWLFSSKGGKTFAIKETSLAPVGSCVRLYLNEKAQNLANENLLIPLIQKYCCLIPLPIYVNQYQQQINHLIPPWRLPENLSMLRAHKKALEFAQVFEHDFEPITTIALSSDNPYQLKGILWVQDGASYASSDNRNVSVFIRNMFVTNQELDILPRWAGFIGAAFESADFSPTASRESLQHDEYFDEVTAYIKETLILGLRSIALSQPETWRRVIKRHNNALLGAALSDERLFEVCNEQLQVHTSQGLLTLPEIVQRSDGIIYIKPSIDSGFEELLFKARKIPIVHGFTFGAMHFSLNYAKNHMIHTHKLGDKDAQSSLFPSVAIDQHSFNELKSLFIRSNEQVVYTAFEPAEIPLIIFEDEAIKLKKAIEADSADKNIGSAVLSLARLHTQTINSAIERKVFLNGNNPIIQTIIQLAPAKQQPMAQVLRAFAYGWQNIESAAGDELYSAFQALNTALLMLGGEKS